MLWLAMRLTIFSSQLLRTKERRKDLCFFIFFFATGSGANRCSLLLKAKAECEVGHIGLSCLVQSGLGWRFYHGDRTQLCHGSEKRQFASFVGKDTSANAWKTSHFINGAI